MNAKFRLNLSLSRILIYIALFAAAIFYLLPVYILLATSLKSYAEVNLATMWSVPREISLESFLRAWNGDPLKGTQGLSSNFMNSLKLVIPSTILSSLLGSLNGYVLSKWKFRGANIIFPALLFGMFIPYQSILIPLVLTMQDWGKTLNPFLSSIAAWQAPMILGWLKWLLLTYTPAYGTIGGLALIHIIYGIPITTLIFRNYYTEIPDELIEAAKIDGASFGSIYRKILFPISMPAFVVVVIWQFQSAWNEFLFATVITNKAEVQPITVALNNLAGSFIVEWNVQMAGALLAALPTLIIFIILGRYFLRGLLAGSLKG